MTNLTKADIVRSTLIVLLLVGIALLLVKVTATLLLIFAATGRKITRREGGILLVTYLVLLVYNVVAV